MARKFHCAVRNWKNIQNNKILLPGRMKNRRISETSENWRILSWVLRKFLLPKQNEPNKGNSPENREKYEKYKTLETLSKRYYLQKFLEIIGNTRICLQMLRNCQKMNKSFKGGFQEKFHLFLLCFYALYDFKEWMTKKVDGLLHNFLLVLKCMVLKFTIIKSLI